MATNPKISKTLSLPDMTDRFGVGGNPPDGYLLTFSAVDGYYVARPVIDLLHTAVVNTSPYNVTDPDVDIVAVQNPGGVFTVNLPVSPQLGTTLFVKDFTGNAATNNINVVSAAGIDGSGTQTISTNRGAMHVAFTGSTWLILSKF